MPEYVKHIEAVGVHGRFDLRLQFQPGVNIVVGRNGTGKTTLLHLLANIMAGDYSRFAFLSFQSICAGLGDGGIITVTHGEANGEPTIRAVRDGECIAEIPVAPVREFGEGRIPPDGSPHMRRRMLGEMEVERLAELEPILRTAYFPAFRTMIEAWAAMEERVARTPPQRWRERATGRARVWFGAFVPSVNFPSLLEIEDRLGAQIREARLAVARADRQLLTEAFLDIFRALSEPGAGVVEGADSILSEIRELFDRLSESPLKTESLILTGMYSQLRQLIRRFSVGEEAESTAVRVLKVYEEMLEQVVNVQERSFEDIQRYLSSVNEFLEDKALEVDPEPSKYRRTAVGVSFSDGSYTASLRPLSSGERQIVTLIYAATHMSKQQLVLIDEPEISLHVDWQRMLIRRMAEQLGDRQIIACTHSPVIGADYEDRVVELQLQPTAEPLPEVKEDEEEEELL